MKCVKLSFAVMRQKLKNNPYLYKARKLNVFINHEYEKSFTYNFLLKYIKLKDKNQFNIIYNETYYWSSTQGPFEKI